MTEEVKASAGRAWRLLDSQAVTRTIQLVAIASLLLALLVGLRQFQLADCLATYSDDNARSSAQRIAAAEQDRKALDEMIAQVAGARSAPPSEAGRQVSEAFDRYLQQRAEADAQRKRNPPPQPPSERCN